MNYRLKSLALWGLFFLTGCTHLPSDESKKTSNAKASVMLEFEKDWVRPTTASKDIGYRKNVRMSPLLLEDRVIQGNGYDGIVAIHRQTGNILWRIPVKGGVEGGATAIKDHLFFGGNDGLFYSISVSSGKVMWTMPVRAETLAAPTISDGIVYFVTGNNILHAVDAVEGKEVWLYSRVDSQNFSIRGSSTPTIKNGVVVVGFSDGYLVALDAKSGGVKWETALNKNKRFRDLDSMPVIDGDRVYVTGYDSHLYCVNLMSGDLIWKTEPGGFGSVLISGDRLIYSSSTGEVISIDKKNGSTLWKYALKEGIATTPVLYLDFVVIGESTGAMKALRLEDGMPAGSLNPGFGLFSPVTVDEGNNEFYFASNGALLYKVKGKKKSEGKKDSWLF